MKLLTILVDNRTDHVIDFDAITPVSNTYVLANLAKTMSLFAFHMQGEDSTSIMLQTDEGSKHAYLKDLETEDDGKDGNEHKLKLKLYLKYGDGAQDNHMGTTQNWNQARLSVQHKAELNVIYNITVEFVLESDDANADKCSASVTLNVVPQSQIYDVVLDYGSEASQMLVVNRDKTASVSNIVPLFSLFKSSCTEDLLANAGRNEHCLQYDSDAGITMMKSVFLVNKAPNPAEKSIYKPFEKDDALYFITDVNDIEKQSKTHFVMPNVKIAGFGGVSLPMVTDKSGIPMAVNLYKGNYFYRRTVNAFIYQAMRYIANDDKPVYLNLCLLTPNIYRQDQVTRNLYDAAEAVREIAAHNSEVACVKGVEVSSVSESDASLLGFINTLPGEVRSNMGHGRYLILDAGKGTLDYSVLDYQPEDPKNQFTSIFRAGLIGAGNALTYALFLSIITYIYKSYWQNVPEHKMLADISSFVSTKLTASSADSAVLSKVMLNLEKYKIMYSSGTLRTDSNVQFTGVESFDKFTLVAFNNCLNDLVKHEHSIGDFSYVTKMMATLAHEAALKFKLSYNKADENAEIKYIVFAGRSFKMSEFCNVVKDAFKEVNPEVCGNMQVQPISLYGEDTGATYKNRCLFILELLRSGRYNGKLVGVPKVLRYMSKGNYRLDEQPSDSSDSQDVTKPKALFAFMQGGKKVLRDIIGALKPTSGVEDVYVDNDLSDPSNYISRELVNGFKVFINSLADMIVISGVPYPIPTQMLAGRYATVFFNGADFEIRQDGGRVGPLVPSPSLSASHVLESMFPYLEHQNGKPLPVPSDAKGVYNPKSNMFITDGGDGDGDGDGAVTVPKGYGAEDEALLKA